MNNGIEIKIGIEDSLINKNTSIYERIPIMEIPPEKQVDLYRTMLTIRRFEERCITDFESGAIPGLIHSYIGQEAIATGVCAHLRNPDRIVSYHRGHGHTIAKGANLNRMMAEVYGRTTGYCRGKGGSMHVADFSIGMLGANGIVGGGIPIGAGAALAAQLEGGDNIAVLFFGDGATNEGEFHEVLNLAAIWKLPLLFACENNGWGVNTPVKYATGLDHISERATGGYGIPSMVVDGNDVSAVYTGTQKAVQHVRQRRGPYFMEYITYRWRAHYEGPGMPDLRPKELLTEWQARCPVKCFEEKLIENGITTRENLDAINTAVMARVDDAAKFAAASPWPAPEDALEDVYSA
jgi:acetoin:2,6-dichlorophenolindophenol oxidoreductase subunit alpha